MRHARLLLPLLLAITAAGCANQKPAYYVTDLATGQRVPVAQQGASGGARGLFTESAPQASPRYAYAAPQAEAKGGGRGLFNSDLFGARSSAPVYAYQAPQAPAPQTYAYQPQPAYAQPAPAPAYQPQPQPAYRPQPTGYYAERYGWY